MDDFELEGQMIRGCEPFLHLDDPDRPSSTISLSVGRNILSFTLLQSLIPLLQYHTFVCWFIVVYLTTL